MLLDGCLFSVFRIVPTLKSAMENGSLCQVLLNKDFFQYGCNRVHLSSSSYVVMVARIVTQKRQGLAPTSFFPSPSTVFLWYKEFHGTIQFGISFLRPKQYRAQNLFFFSQKKPTTTYFFVPD